MKAWDYLPGIPAAGHVTSGGHWHSGDRRTCSKCRQKDRQSRRDKSPLLPKDHQTRKG